MSSRHGLRYSHARSTRYVENSAIEWDAANLRVTNAPDANALLKREYRPGWTL